MHLIDINCDLGEGVLNERELFPYISSCNIACGGHFGNSTSMRDTALLAKEYKVRIGAHPSYPDPENFGRKSMSISPRDLQNTLTEQIQSLLKVLMELGLDLHHIKAHGALYNDIVKDPTIAEIYLNTLKEYKKELILFLPANSSVLKKARKIGFNCWSEGFGDRRYNSKSLLVSRNFPKATISNPKMVTRQILEMVAQGKITTIEGQQIKIAAETICIHGDGPNAFQILVYLSTELANHNIYIKK
ncbi:5-oxoprolinase subunit PxpA [Eudoraea chungangensis]|uniref:5-oxoprolinase subunit PxpA n=1 Tax=Eudoraea chungangensis TaxID=1481905 RepID=UPI0023ECC81C|nr:5-oxoprolinase subunit PxpA [Eudoraea chungangensis]